MGNQVIAKFGQTKRTVMIELVLILAFIFAYTHIPFPAKTAYSPAAGLVATPAPVPSLVYSVVPDHGPVQAKAKTPPKVPKHAPAAKPAPVPAIAIVRDVPPAPVAEPAAADISKPAVVSAPVTASKDTAINVPEHAPEVVANEAVVPASEPAATVVSNPEVIGASGDIHEPAPVTDSNGALVANVELSSVSVLKTFPAPAKSPTQAAPSEPISPATPLVTGTTAALIFAPIAAPVSIIFGIVVGLLTPSSSQLGQVGPAPKPKARVIPNADPSSAY
jgi:hypothetical protein